MMTDTLTAPLEAPRTCPTWCDGSHGEFKPGDEVGWHSRVFAEKEFPNGRKVEIRAGWGEPLTRWCVGMDGGYANFGEPPYIRIVHIDDTGPSFVEVGTFDAMVLADCMRISGDGWLGETLAKVAGEVDDGTPVRHR